MYRIDVINGKYVAVGDEGVVGTYDTEEEAQNVITDLEKDKKPKKDKKKKEGYTIRRPF